MISSLIWQECCLAGIAHEARVATADCPLYALLMKISRNDRVNESALRTPEFPQK